MKAKAALPPLPVIPAQAGIALLFRYPNDSGNSKIKSDSRFREVFNQRMPGHDGQKRARCARSPIRLRHLPPQAGERFHSPP